MTGMARVGAMVGAMAGAKAATAAVESESIIDREMARGGLLSYGVFVTLKSPPPPYPSPDHAKLVTAASGSPGGAADTSRA